MRGGEVSACAAQEAPSQKRNEESVLDACSGYFRSDKGDTAGPLRAVPSKAKCDP